MFKSYLSRKEHQYTPLWEQGEGHCQLPLSNDNKVNRRRIFVYAVLVVEALHLSLFLAMYAGRYILSDVHMGHELDTCTLIFFPMVRKKNELTDHSNMW
jgi:hypothetical protein